MSLGTCSCAPLSHIVENLVEHCLFFRGAILLFYTMKNEKLQEEEGGLQTKNQNTANA